MIQQIHGICIHATQMTEKNYVKLQETSRPKGQKSKRFADKVKSLLKLFDRLHLSINSCKISFLKSQQLEEGSKKKKSKISS